MTFSERIGVYDLRSPIPHIKHIAIHESGECTLGLEELVPLSNSLVEVSFPFPSYLWIVFLALWVFFFFPDVITSQHNL